MTKSFLLACGVAAFLCLQASAVGLVVGGTLRDALGMCLLSLSVSAVLVSATAGIHVLASWIGARRRKSS